MSEFIACLSDPACPGRIELIASRHDPRLEAGEGFAMLRERGWPTIEWTLKVADRNATISALSQALSHAHCGNGYYTCHPMDARGKAIALTTQRPAPKPVGLLTRLGLRRRVA